MVFEIVSWLALILGTLVKFVGFPEQFLLNRARRSTEGVSRWFYILALLSYALWSIQGYLAHDLVVCVGQGLGVITAGAIVWQIIIYRRAPLSSDRTSGTVRAKLAG